MTELSSYEVESFLLAVKSLGEIFEIQARIEGMKASNMYPDSNYGIDEFRSESFKLQEITNELKRWLPDK